jgi:hypothetical protein
LPIGLPSRSISISQASRASCSAVTCSPWYMWKAFSRPTVKLLDEPSPAPSDGMSESKVTSTPRSTPVTRIDSRISSCSISSTLSTISVRV